MALKAMNAAFSTVGLKLDSNAPDFQNVFLDAHTRQRLIQALAKSYDDWLEVQHTVDVQRTYDTKGAVEVFLEDWLASPFRERGGGSRFNNLLWLSLISRSFKPDLIVDSGTFQGASAWALHHGSPDCPLFSFDIDHSYLKRRCDGHVTYVEQDWMKQDLPEANRILAYFDDHLDQVNRLRQAIERKVRLAIFDDDFPLTAYYAMAPNPHVLPKIEFVLDDSLKDGMELSWRSGGREHVWVVDRAYLDSVKPHIVATERLPNTSHITAIHQTPYRVVALKP